MGIKNLMKVLIDKTPTAIKNISNNQLINKKVAIDTSIILYQYVTAIKTMGGDLTGPSGASTSHIMGMLVKTLQYFKLGIIPVYIFDGKPPELKMKILRDRSKIKKEALAKLLELQEKQEKQEKQDKDQDKEYKIKLLQKSVSISGTEMKQAAEIATLLGVPCIFAPEEADSQCAYLSINNIVDYVASEDMDLLTFGTKKLIKNFSKKGMYEISLENILKEGNMNMDIFVDLCILLGCDYTDTIDGIGQKKAWDLIKKYGSLDELIMKNENIQNNKYKLPDNFRYEESREYFKNPRHIKVESNDIKLETPKLNELKQLLVNTYGFNEDNVENMLKFLRRKHNIYDSNYKEKIKQDIFVED
jgi:flap endonuclease-1